MNTCGVTNAAPSLNYTKIESFAVDIDGVRKLDQLSFVAAIKAAMEFRLKLPDSCIHVCDASEPPMASSHLSAPVAA